MASIHRASLLKIRSFALLRQLAWRSAYVVAGGTLIVSCGQDDGPDIPARGGATSSGGTPAASGGAGQIRGGAPATAGGVSSAHGGGPAELAGAGGETSLSGGATPGGSSGSGGVVAANGGRTASASGGAVNDVEAGVGGVASGGTTGSESGAGGDGGDGGTLGAAAGARSDGGTAGALTSGGTAALGGSGGSGVGGSGVGGSGVGGSGVGGSGGVGGAGGSFGAPVLTRSYNPARTGSNLSETTLSPATFREHIFGKLFCKPVDDEIYAQILYVGALDLGARGLHNVVFVATMNDSVYAFDADDPDPNPLWHVNYTDTARGITPVPTADLGGGWCPTYKDISHQVGITSTPVIDPGTSTMYLVARTKENGSYVPRLHALDIRTGDERPGSPAVIRASAAGTGVGSRDGVLSLDPKLNNQRMAVTLVEKSLFIGFASHCDTGPYHGWLLRYDADTLAQTGAFTTTPDGQGGGIWMSGAAPAVDATGNLYLTVGNGTSDTASSGQNYSQSFIEITGSGSGIQVSDWFTPWNYVRTNGQDLDIGSSGPVLIPNSPILLGGGKEGRLYLLDSHKLGNFDPQGKQVFQEFMLNGIRGRSHIHGVPVYWKSTNGEFVYIMSEEDHVRQFQLQNNQLAVVHTSEVVAPVEQMTASGTTMPGGILSLSAAGDRAGSGLVWVNINSTGDANQAVVPGVLRVFDADDVTKELWNSDLSPQDSFGEFAKFNPPTVTGGRVYVGTFSGQFCAYGVVR